MDYEPDENNENRKTLCDEEFAEVLKRRDDIFAVETTWIFRAIEITSLIIGIALGIFLSTAQAIKIAPDFYVKILNERSARLLHKPVFASVLQKNVEERANAEPLREEVRSQPVSGNRIKDFRIRKSDNAAVKNVPEVSHKPHSLESKINGTTVSAAEGLTEDDASLLKIGLANKFHGNREQAFTAFRRLIKKNPHNIEALEGMGDLFLYTGILDSAVTFYTSANAENPNNAAVHQGLGSVRYYLSELAANPNFAIVHNIANPSQYIRAQYDSAVAEYTKAIILDSSKVGALTNRGVIRDIHGDHAAALEDYSRAIKIRPAYAEAYSKRAATYKTLGKLSDAIADYTTAIRLDSNSYEFDPTLHFANAYFGRGNVYIQIGNYKAAVADFDSTLRLMPHHPLAMLNKARALVEIRQYDSAAVWYTKAIETLSPKEYNGAMEHAYFGRGLVYNMTNQPALALKDFDDALRLKADDYFAYFHRGNAYKAQSRFDEAIADYSRAVDFSALAAKACWRIAECFSLKKDKTDALLWLEKSVSKGFKNSTVWNQDQDLDFVKDDKDFQKLAHKP